jgi:hypothetical protein
MWGDLLPAVRNPRQAENADATPLGKGEVESSILSCSTSLSSCNCYIIFDMPSGNPEGMFAVSVRTDAELGSLTRNPCAPRPPRRCDGRRGLPSYRFVSGRPITARGFRATFGTLAEEVATVQHAVAEQALGHAVGTQVERAYGRTDVLDQRRKLMDAWASFCEPKVAG